MRGGGGVEGFVCQQQTLESVRSRGEPWGEGPTSYWNEQQKHPQLKKTFIHQLKYSLIAEGESASEASDKKLFPTGQPPLRHRLIPGNLVCVNGYNGPGFLATLANGQQRERLVYDKALNLHHATVISAKTSSASIQATVEQRGCVEFTPLQRESGKSRTRATLPRASMWRSRVYDHLMTYPRRKKWDCTHSPLISGFTTFWCESHPGDTMGKGRECSRWRLAKERRRGICVKHLC